MPNKIKKILYIISFFILISLFICLLLLTKDSRKIVEITEFVKTETKVLYITNNDKLDYPVEIMEKYNISYLKIDSSKLSIFEQKRLKNIIENNYLNNILLVYENGKMIDKLVKYETKDSVNEFLQKNSIIPEKIVDNVDEIMNNANNILESQYSIVYIPYQEHEEVIEQNKIFEEIAEKYSIDYKKIDAYLLSRKQQESINKLLDISLVEDQILILVKDNKVVANIRGIHRKKTYIETLSSVNFINELEIKINQINFEDLEKKLEIKEKNIILVGLDDTKDTKDVFDSLNKMIYKYDINVDYIDVELINSELHNKVKNKFESIGYKEAFSLPMVVITEDNKILDYAIGNSKEEYFIDIFIENGVVKGDVINE